MSATNQIVLEAETPLETVEGNPAKTTDEKGNYNYHEQVHKQNKPLFCFSF